MITGGTSISLGAFYGCTNLISVTIPDSVTSIGSVAFYGCTELANIYYMGTSSEWAAKNINLLYAELTSAMLYYYSETQPIDTIYNYWHYVDGVPTKWESN